MLIMHVMLSSRAGSAALEPTRQQRWRTAICDKALNWIRDVRLIETQAEHLLRVLEKCTVLTNVHRRKLHNFCLDMNWLPWPVIPKRQWPLVQFKEKRAITPEEHASILAQRPILNRGDSTSCAGSSAPVRATWPA